ncbi:acetyl esterase/lipase [Rhizobium sp. PP-CC-2G-626]|nr:acetyl esterase/lipase [Rhizobium sp. PP-CC-2G-626]
MHALRPIVFLIAGLAVAQPVLSQEIRDVPSRQLPLPEAASPELRALIQTGSMATWNDHPATAEEWKLWIAAGAEKASAGLPALREKMGVTVEASKIAGVNVFEIVPKEISPENRERVLIHFHGGGYVLNPGEAGTGEAIMMAGLGQVRVISVDYRMPPDFPYPAAMDDALAVYKGVLEKSNASRIGVFGTSTGGGMALALGLRAKAEGLPLPGAIAAGTPWADLDKIGDSYFSNDGVDNVLVRYEGWLGDAAKLYADGHDMKDPYLSPIYGDYRSFPPTILVTGTRDLFLSNTVRVHRKLRESGAVADLVVFEGLSHAQYLFSPDMHEAREYFREVEGFFDGHLKR